MKVGRELDVLIAEKVMGWVRFTNREWLGDRYKDVYPTGRQSWNGPDDSSGYWHDPSTKKPTYALVEHPYADDPTFSPSTSIADAWLVVEKLDMTITLEKHEDGWCLWENPCDYRDYPPDFVGHSAAYVICLAALKAVGYQEEV